MYIQFEFSKFTSSFHTLSDGILSATGRKFAKQSIIARIRNNPDLRSIKAQVWVLFRVELLKSRLG